MMRSFCLLSFMALKISAFMPGHTTHTDTAHQTGQLMMSTSNQQDVSRRSLFHNTASTIAAIASTSAAITAFPLESQARLEAVDRPDLLPKEAGLNVIQVEKFLTTGQAKRMDSMLTKLESDTGFRLRVLCQAYPNTPGTAIKNYWDLGKEGQKDDKYIVLVVDQFGGKGNVLNFNVGEGMKLNLPNVFWTRLQAKYGTTFYVKENGIDFAITNAVESVVTCLRSSDQFCMNVPDEGASMKSLGF